MSDEPKENKHTKLAHDWIDDLIEREGKHRLSECLLTYDPNCLWNGYNSQLLAVKNRTHKIIAVVSNVSLSSPATEVLKRVTNAREPRMEYERAERGWTQVYRRPAVEWNVAVLDRVDLSFASCNLATLRPCILETSDRYVQRMLRWYSNPTDTVEWTNQQWSKHAGYLSSWGLGYTEAQKTKRQVAIAKARLKQ